MRFAADRPSLCSSQCAVRDVEHEQPYSAQQETGFAGMHRDVLASTACERSSRLRLDQVRSVSLSHWTSAGPGISLTPAHSKTTAFRPSSPPSSPPYPSPYPSSRPSRRSRTRSPGSRGHTASTSPSRIPRIRAAHSPQPICPRYALSKAGRGKSACSLRSRRRGIAGRCEWGTRSGGV